MGFWTWIWSLFSGGSASDFAGEAGINARPNERTDAVVGGVSQEKSAEKTFYLQIKKDIKQSKKALDSMDRLTDIISIDYRDMQKAVARMTGSDAEKQAELKNQLDFKTTKDLEEYLWRYKEFLNATANILTKEKEMIGFEDRFLKSIFLQIRDLVYRKTLSISQKDLTFLKDGLNKLILEQRQSLQKEKNEDIRYSRGHKTRIGLFERFLGDAHFVNKVKKDLKQWNREEKQEIRLDSQIFDALSKGQMSVAIPLIEAHLNRVKENTFLLEKLSKDDQIALEDAIRLSDGVVAKVRSSAQVQFYPTQTLVDEIMLWHSNASRLMQNDSWNSSHFDGSLVVLQRELNKILDDIGGISVRDARLESLRAMKPGAKAA